MQNKTIKVHQLPKLQDITESHLDNFIVDALNRFRFFQEFLVNKFNPKWKYLEHIKSEKGKIESGGQTDVKSLIRINSDLTLLMIENKISHEQQLDQSDRYLIRGERHKKNNECKEFATFLIAPKEYIDKRKPTYQFNIAIEEIRDLFKQQNLNYEVNLLDLFIEKCSCGYIKIVNYSHTEKWVEIYNEILKLHPILNPTKPNEKSRAEFYRMRPPHLQGRKEIRLVYKFQAYDRLNSNHKKGERHRADLEFKYWHLSLSEVKERFEKILEPGMKIVLLQGRNTSERSSAIRLCFRDVSFEKSFEEEQDIYIQGINGLRKLYDFYLKYVANEDN